MRTPIWHLNYYFIGLLTAELVIVNFIYFGGLRLDFFEQLRSKHRAPIFTFEHLALGSYFGRHKSKSVQSLEESNKNANEQHKKWQSKNWAQKS